MKVTFSNKHCLAPLDFSKPVQPDTIIVDSQYWVAMQCGLSDWLWFSTTDMGYDHTQHWDVLHYEAKQHPPKTVVSMVQE